MIVSPSRLSSAHSDLVLDASVVINLLGTGNPGLLLRSLNRQVFVDEITLAEVHVNPASGRPSDELLQSLQSDGFLKVLRMSSAAYERFVGLTGATPPDDLDDGEAATLVQAMFNGRAAVVDERKATRIAASLVPEVVTLNSLDLLAAPELFAVVGSDDMSELIYRALRNARMRVPPDFRKWVTGILGAARVADCPSLGGRQVADVLKR